MGSNPVGRAIKIKYLDIDRREVSWTGVNSRNILSGLSEGVPSDCPRLRLHAGYKLVRRLSAIQTCGSISNDVRGRPRAVAGKAL